MGTSVNQHSPRTTGWASVAAGYVHNQITPQRVANEIWRAAQSEPGFADALASPTVFECHQVVRAAPSVDDAISLFTEAVRKAGNNSVVVEFAKRSIPAAFGRTTITHVAWRAILFEQLTEYFVSRDIPGYVGGKGRFSTVEELATFKRTLRNHVASVVSTIPADPMTPKQWADFVKATVKKVSG